MIESPVNLSPEARRRVLSYSDVFRAFSELLDSRTTEDRTLSNSACDGLAFLFELLAEDAERTFDAMNGDNVRDGEVYL